VSEDPDLTAKQIAEFDAADYVVVTAGRFDIMIEVVAEDTHQLLELMNQIRSLDSVAATELFTYLRLEKQTYNWGTR